MRHGKAHRKLNVTASHRKAMFSNMAASLINNEQIKTTLPKAKEIRPIVEQLITLGKKGGLANRRRATSLPRCFQLLPSRPRPHNEQDPSIANGPHDLWRCPQCRGPMVVIERLTPAEIQLRSPPLPVSDAA